MVVHSQEQAHQSDTLFMALFARMDTVAMSAGVAVAFGLGLAAATGALLLAGAPPGAVIGPNLSVLGNILPGYRVTWLGCLIGAGWAAVIGATAGFLFATFWNFAHIVSLALIALFYRRERGSLELTGSQSPELSASVSRDQRLHLMAVRLNVWISSLGIGMGLGLLLFLATRFSLAVSDHPGRYMNLLGIFMPGYAATSQGSWFGLLWGLFYGALSGGVITALYEHNVGASLPELVMWDEASVRRLRPPFVRISSHALGLALGVVVAFQLLLATCWLVLRGTADESIHAKLLSNYLPGYTVSLQGGLLGALELFFLVYLFTTMVGEIYNCAARVRHK